MSPDSVHHALLAPAILQILRATGFHSTRPSVLDTLTDLCSRYILLLASKTAEYAYSRSSSSAIDGHGALFLHSDHDSPDPVDDVVITSTLDIDEPGVADVRQAFDSVAVFNSALTSSEEAWQEVLRKPLDEIHLAARDKEGSRRTLEDTKDVREFIDWVTGPINREIRRIAGLLQDEEIIVITTNTGAVGGAMVEGLSLERNDYLLALKKKHSKTGDASRYAGTALGKMADEKGPVKVEGGPTLAQVREKRRILEHDVNGGNTSTKKIAS